MPQGISLMPPHQMLPKTCRCQIFPSWSVSMPLQNTATKIQLQIYHFHQEFNSRLVAIFLPSYCKLILSWVCGADVLTYGHALSIALPSLQPVQHEPMMLGVCNFPHKQRLPETHVILKAKTFLHRQKPERSIGENNLLLKRESPGIQLWIVN